MGLDMYLYSNTFVGGEYDHRGVKGKIKGMIEGKPFEMPLKNVSEITQRVGYWRKANAVHAWFVEHVQDGEDDCGRYLVSRQDLEELRSQCERVLEGKDEAADAFPTREGFFFGGTEYDEYYFDSLRDTVAIVDRALESDLDQDFYYQSSW